MGQKKGQAHKKNIAIMDLFIKVIKTKDKNKDNESNVNNDTK